jgi:hypothetical protein
MIFTTLPEGFSLGMNFFGGQKPPRISDVAAVARVLRASA